MAVPHDRLRVEFGGAEVDGLYQDALSLEVELDEELAGMFRLTLALPPAPDGSWPYVDDERLALWQPVTVTGGLTDDARELLRGYVTHLRPEFGPGLEQCRLAVWGMDATVLMDRADRLKDWPNKKDSDIAAEVFRTYGLTPQVTDTAVVHDEEVSTVIQRETDIRLLRRLALRNGYECFVDGGTGYFRPPALDGPDQPVLAVHFGGTTNVNSFALQADALLPAGVAMFQFDHLAGTLLEERVERPAQRTLGGTPASGLPASGLPAAGATGLVAVGQTVTTGRPEMAALCRGLYDRTEWFVTGEGEVDAHAYGAVLKPRDTVTVKGVGETHSGVYYVTRVTHTFTPEGYVQGFQVKRNALRPAGDEDFTSGTADAGLSVGLAAGAVTVEVAT